MVAIDARALLYGVTTMHAVTSTVLPRSNQAAELKAYEHVAIAADMNPPCSPDHPHGHGRDDYEGYGSPCEEHHSECVCVDSTPEECHQPEKCHQPHEKCHQPHEKCHQPHEKCHQPLEKRRNFARYPPEPDATSIEDFQPAGTATVLDAGPGAPTGDFPELESTSIEDYQSTSTMPSNRPQATQPPDYEEADPADPDTPPQKPTYTPPKPAYEEADPPAEQPDPPAEQPDTPQPTYTQPASTYQAPQPTYGPPPPDDEQPDPNYEQDDPNYEQPDPNYKQQDPSYKKPEQNYGPPPPDCQSCEGDNYSDCQRCEENKAECESCGENKAECESCEENKAECESCGENKAECESCRKNKGECEGCEKPNGGECQGKLNKPGKLWRLRTHVVDGAGDAEFENLYVQRTEDGGPNSVPKLSCERETAGKFFYDGSTSSVNMWHGQCNFSGLVMFGDNDADAYSPAFISESVGTHRMRAGWGSIWWDNDRFDGWVVCKCRDDEQSYELQWQDAIGNQGIDEDRCAKVELLTENC